MATKSFVMALCLLAALFSASSASAISEELIVKTCPELMRMAQNLQEDLKTADIMLGSALESGSMTNVKNYKMRKETANKQLQSVLQAINIRGCSK